MKKLGITLIIVGIFLIWIFIGTVLGIPSIIAGIFALVKPLKGRKKSTRFVGFVLGCVISLLLAILVSMIFSDMGGKCASIFSTYECEPLDLVSGKVIWILGFSIILGFGWIWFLYFGVMGAVFFRQYIEDKIDWRKFEWWLLIGAVLYLIHFFVIGKGF